MNPAAEERRRNIRAALVGVGLIGLLLALSARLYSIQVRDNGKYRAMALGQHRKIRDLPPYRGDILSSDGKIVEVAPSSVPILAITCRSIADRQLRPGP